MKIHQLKTDSTVFQASWEGKKSFEVRNNDRDYKQGDMLVLMETLASGEAMKDGASLRFSGRMLISVVSYVLYGPVYGLADGWCMMSTDIIWQQKEEVR